MKINIKLSYIWYFDKSKDKDKYHDVINTIQRNDPKGYKPTGIVTQFVYFWDKHSRVNWNK